MRTWTLDAFGVTEMKPILTDLKRIIADTTVTERTADAQPAKKRLQSKTTPTDTNPADDGVCPTSSYSPALGKYLGDGAVSKMNAMYPADVIRTVRY